MLQNLDINTIKEIKTKIHPMNEQFDKLTNHQKQSGILIKNRPANEVRLLTYNIYCLPKNVVESHQTQRIFEIVQSLEEYDICCLQEVFSGLFSNNREELITCAKKAGFIYHVEDE